MSVSSKPPNNIVIIKADQTKEFINKFNSNITDKKFLDSCKKAGKLFKKEKK